MGVKRKKKNFKQWGFKMHYFFRLRQTPDLYLLIDKIAARVAKSGSLLETKIKENNIGDPRFSFFSPWNEHHTYYKRKVQEFIQKNADMGTMKRKTDAIDVDKVTTESDLVSAGEKCLYLSKSMPFMV